MESIKDPSVKMHSKQYYLGLTLLMLAASFMFIGISALAISILSHDDRVGRDLHSIGIETESSQLPAAVITALIIILGVAGSVFILKKFRAAYKHSFILLYISVLIIVGLVSLAAFETGVAGKLSGNTTLSPLAPFSREYVKNHVGGQVVEISSDNIVIRTAGGREFEVQISSNTKLSGAQVIKAGDFVVITLSSDNDDQFQAEMIIVNPPQNKTMRIGPKFKMGEINHGPMAY